jgi:hypothetical protein
MAWEFDMGAGDVTLERDKIGGASSAESAYRVKIGSKVVYRGWCHDSFAEFRRLIGNPLPDQTAG